MNFDGNETEYESLLPQHQDETALSKYWKVLCAAAWINFIAFEIAIGCDKYINSRPLCPFEHSEFEESVDAINIFVFGGFFFVWLVLLQKVYTVRSGQKRVPLLTAFNIVSIGLIATFLVVAFDWGGVCIDVLGVASPAAIWPEWISCGPLLVFITVTFTGKASLSRMDIFLMVMFYLCILTGYLIIVSTTYATGVFWLIMSCLTYLPLLYLPFYRSDPLIDHNDKDSDKKLASFAVRYARQRNIAIWLTIILPLYTVNYLLALFKGIDVSTTIGTYQVLSVLTKGLFAAFTMDLHLDLLVKTEQALVQEKRMNDARRTFMKYIFHEVRNPLNSLTVGIKLLMTSPALEPQDKDSLEMMDSASKFMKETLDNVLNLHRIEEGHFELDISPFSLKETIKRVVSMYGGIIMDKDLTLVYDISPDVPAILLGDSDRIAHVVSNFISNAIKFSPKGEIITLRSSVLSKRKDTEKNAEIVTIVISVEDKGPGISKENQDKLFRNFMQIRPDVLQSGQVSIALFTYFFFSFFLTFGGRVLVLVCSSVKSLPGCMAAQLRLYL